VVIAPAPHLAGSVRQILPRLHRHVVPGGLVIPPRRIWLTVSAGLARRARV